MYSYLNAPYWTEVIFWFPQAFSLLQLQLPSLIPCDSLHLMATSNHMKSCRLLAMLGTASNIFEDFIESQRFLVFSMRMVSPAFQPGRTSFHSSRSWGQWITRTSLWGIDGLGLHLCLIQALTYMWFDDFWCAPMTSCAHHVTMKQVGWKCLQCCYFEGLEFKTSPLNSGPNQLAKACMYFEEMKMFRTSCRWSRTSKSFEENHPKSHWCHSLVTLQDPVRRRTNRFGRSIDQVGGQKPYQNHL